MFSGNSSASNQLVKSKKNNNVESVAMKNAQRELYDFRRPEQQLGMSDLVKQHNNGERFLFAAITSKQEEEESSILRRLITHRPRLGRKELDVGELPVLRLYDSTESFNLSRVLKGAKLKSYIHLTEIMVVFAPLVSSDSTFTKIKICVVDDRLVNRKVVKEYTANSNMMSRAVLSLSYCFPKEDVNSVSLTIGRDTEFLEEGKQWGVVQIRIRLAEYDFPIQTSNTGVKAILNVPESVLDTTDVDPNSVDISMTETNVSDMRELALRGDLADETETIKEKTEEVKYKKSIMREKRGKRIESHHKDWDFMSSYRQSGIPEDQQSNDSPLSQSEDSESDDVFYPMGRASVEAISPDGKRRKTSVKFRDVSPVRSESSWMNTKAYKPKSVYVPGNSRHSRSMSVADIQNQLDKKLNLDTNTRTPVEFP